MFPSIFFIFVFVLQAAQFASSAAGIDSHGVSPHGVLSPRRVSTALRVSSEASLPASSDSSKVSESELLSDGVELRPVWRLACESTDDQDVSESVGSSEEENGAVVAEQQSSARMTRERWIQLVSENRVPGQEESESEEELEFGHLTPAERLEGFGMRKLMVSAAKEYWAAINRGDPERELVGIITMLALGVALRWSLEMAMSFFVVAMAFLSTRRPL